MEEDGSVLASQFSEAAERRPGRMLIRVKHASVETVLKALVNGRTIERRNERSCLIPFFVDEKGAIKGATVKQNRFNRAVVEKFKSLPIITPFGFQNGPESKRRAFCCSYLVGNMGVYLRR